MDTVPPPVRMTAEDINLQLETVRTTCGYFFDMVTELLPPDAYFVINGEKKTRKEIQATKRAVDKQIKKTEKHILKNVRRRKGVRINGEPRKPSVFSKPKYYQKELIAFILSAKLGNVDPENPNSQPLNDYLKKSIIGTEDVASNTIFSILFPLWISVNGLKNKNNGRQIDIPLTVFQKQLKNAYTSLKDKMNFSNFQWFDIGKVVRSEIISVESLDDKQKAFLTNEDTVKAVLEVEKFIREVKSKHDEKIKNVGETPLPTVVVPPTPVVAPIAKRNVKSPKN
jgi:hypothetical protein